MIDFIEYVVAELKSKRLSKSNALALIKQFSRQAQAAGGSCRLHPLLHCNVSDLTQQSYRSTFTGDELFLRDHRIQGRKVLPAVAYLEMSRAALTQAAPEAGQSLELRNAIWAQPVVVAGPTDVNLALYVSEESAASQDQVDVEIYGADDTVHFQAQAVLGCGTPAPARIDIDALSKLMSKGALDGSSLYEHIAQGGVELGPAQRGVMTLHRGEQQVLARIRRPDVADGGHEQYLLHPSVMDSAVQAGMSLLIEATPGATPVPFALESLRIFAGCRKEMLAWVRYSAGSSQDDKVVKLDIDLCDLEGNVCVQMLGFSARVLGAEARQSGHTGCLLAVPTWEAMRPAASTVRYDATQVVLCDLPGIDAGAIGGNCLEMKSTAGASLASRYTELALRCFELIQRTLSSKPQGKVLLQLVIDGAKDRLLSGLSGLTRTAMRENPKLVAQVVLADPDVPAGRLQEQLREAAASGEPVVGFDEGHAKVQRWRELSGNEAAPRLAFKDQGVYLITGGLGGLGVLFAREIIGKTTNARVILTGRSDLTGETRAKLAEVGAADRVLYRRLDVCDRDQVQQLVAAVVREFGQLNGIIHSAGVISDGFILKKTATEFQRVLAPKVVGTCNLDEASRDLDLDFLALFSSSAGAFGNAGQADYAAANAFMDAFAAHRNRLVANNARRGLTLSFDWPLWEHGGMQVDASTREMLRETIGMQPMGTDVGMQAFQRGLELQHPQLLVMAGDLQHMRRALQRAPAQQVQGQATTHHRIESDDFAQRTEEYLRQQFSVVLKLAAHRVDPQAPLERYGIDSILAMELTGQLERTFGSLPKTLFFEYQTIRELSAYFIREHAARLTSLFSGASTSAAAEPAPALPAEGPKIERRVRTGKRFQRRRDDERAMSNEPIAIVGLSGRYPEAPDLETYWRNLRDGRDCITEIPRDRWDWREYFSDDRTACGCHFSKWGGFISGVDEFDPLFFNIPPVDAEMIDPQERLFLQHAWMAVEDAGYTRASLRALQIDDMPGQVGVYVGVMYGEYQLFGAEASLQGKRMGVPVSYASIANRVSYVMDLHGPSMTLDTMCSSSLTAIHLACQDLRLGRTRLAIAGGVNVTIHPNKYLILSAGQFISSDGHCQSFGEGGDGYVPGEGVGVAVLKRLSDAVRDGNHIYGVIKASALNHGGKTNGYSVPNPQAQANVIARALKECGLDARHIGYIEAHGTGTKLGDPIEIAALTQVFRRYTQEKQFCAIGSAKSNIGHCESAAGIAGLTKVLLQMKHRQLVPSLHSSTLNPHIDFESSPFVVNQVLRPWDQPEVDGKRLPRIAGISSFGAGGSNAHLIVEEYVAPASEAVPAPRGPVIVPLSARTSEQLQQKVRDLLAFIRARQEPIDLASMAYTLQLGREPMARRLALLVDSVEQLADRLEAWQRGESDIAHCFEAEAGQGTDSLAVLSQDDDMREAIERWIARGKLSKLADLWVKGLELDWRKLHGERPPRWMSLPTYPFARERYSVARHVQRHATLQPGTSALHPLLHKNTSDFSGQSYESSFAGNEIFLTDHQVEIDGSSRKVLPAVAYLEMVRAAVAFALPDGASGALDLVNVAWTRPLIVDRESRVRVVLSPSGERAIDFDVSSSDGVSHCEGQVWMVAPATVDALDVSALQARMSRGSMAAPQLYDAFKAMGIHYGPAFRGVARVHRGDGELLAELVLPDVAEPLQVGYLLSPSLLDSALQAAIGLSADPNDLPRKPAVPFALDSLRVIAKCEPRMFAWVRYSTDAQASPGLTKIDIDLCDQNGRPCVQMRGLTSRVLATDESGIGSLIALPVWETIEQPASQSVRYDQHDVVLCNLPKSSAQALQAALPDVTVESLDLRSGAGVAERYRDAALGCFRRLQVILKSAPTGRRLFQLVIATEAEGALFAGLSGLIRTARLENPHLVGQILLTGGNSSPEALAARLRAAKALPDEVVLESEGPLLRGMRWKSQPLPSGEAASFKDGGVYMITGGLGGLGLLFAREILGQAPTATVILTGRAPLDSDKRARIEALTRELRVAETQVAYCQLDVADAAEVEELIANLRRKFGRMDGVLHSAGMTRDGFITHKTAADFADVLTPKVEGVVNLDLATRNLDLDFLALFSSVSAAHGNVGQADYATANAFMDEYARYRNQLVRQGLRRGRTLSINWPLWAEGGMRLDADSQEMLHRAAGMVPLPTAIGMRAFHASLAMQSSQALVMAGDVERLQRALDVRRTVAEDPVADAPATGNATAVLEQARNYLAREFAELVQVAVHEVDPKAPLERYGIDSVLAMKFTHRLEAAFGPLSKTLLFEYQSIGALAGYFAKAFPATVRALSGGVEQAAKPATVSPDCRASERLPVVARRAGQRFMVPASPSQASAPVASQPRTDDIAIIGVSGRYPLADDLQQFWDNLKNGRDCITEVPRERWDHDRYFHPERNQPGKTYGKWGGFIDGVDRFDALFFGISPKEAELIDPQERLFLETVWHAIEDAGYSKERIAAHRVGVYVGVMWGQYELYAAGSAEAGVPSSSFASIANRVSYFFDFHGPSLAVDTMCSSSLTALHLAVEELRRGAVDVAIAGGVNVSIHPNKYLSLSQGNFASTDGRCRSFGQGGDGYVPGEGVGAVLLKPLAKALAEGDRVYAVIKASSINHGGKTNGYTVPNPVAQAELISHTLAAAGIDPSTIDYIEAHGTGTALGDPIEITGLSKAFAGRQPRQQRCAIGSVKSNIGHLESAAGIAALTKVLLQLQHQQLVPSLHAQPLNPLLDFESTPFYVQTTLQDWPRVDGRPRRAGISSFGAGGSNAHVILEEFIDPRPVSAQVSRPEALVLSARNKDALADLARSFIDFLGTTESSLADIAFTSQVGRTPLQERLVVIASSREETRQKLNRWLADPRGVVDDLYAANIKAAAAHASLIEGEAGAAFLRLTLQHRDLARLAKLWIAGVEIDWALLHEGEARRRVALPKYPFQRERFWIDVVPQWPERSMQHPVEHKQLIYYRVGWREAPPVRATAAQSAPILVLDSSDELVSELRRQSSAQVVVSVRPGNEYRQLDETTFTVNVAVEQDFERLMQALQARGLMPGAIVHRWAAQLPVPQQLEWGLVALHCLSKALLGRKPANIVRIVSLATGDAGAPLHRALDGFFKTLSLENPKLAGKALAMPRAMSRDVVVRRLLDELSEAGNDREVRYEPSGRRCVRTLERLHPSTTGQAAVKHNGVYVITGGLGGLGYIVAEHLVRSYQARIAMLGRSELNETQQRKLDALRVHGADGMGSAVIYWRADVGDAEQVAKVMREIKQRFGRIDGIFHSAGVNRDAFVLHKTREEMEVVLRAKVFGALNLDAATRDDALDLFVLFSSAAGVLGNAGQSDYAFANSFLDAFAEQRQALVRAGQRSGRTLSIDWPFWRDGGMKLPASDIEMTEQRAGISPLPTQEGLECLETLLRTDATQCLVLYGVASKIDAVVSRTPAPALPDHALESPTSAASPTGAPSCEALLQRTQLYLAELLSEQIKLPVERIDPQERFEAFGVDSMMVARINGRLQRDLGELPKTLFYEYASIEELAAYLAQEARSGLERMFGVAAADAPAEEPRIVPTAPDTAAPAPSTLAEAHPPAVPASVASIAAPPSAAIEAAQPTVPMSAASIEAHRPVAPAATRSTEVQPSAAPEPIAIIGLHGMFPRSETLAEFWDHLLNGRDLIEEVPANRWDWRRYFDADPERARDGKIYCKSGGFLADFDKFDAAFFGIPAEDARLIDPQERLFLQSVWAAIEDAGYTRELLKRRHPKGRSKNGGADVGVFGGVTTNSYQLLTTDEWNRGNMVTPGAMPWSIVNRVSYVFDFQGPSMPVDTACSSSLVAMHLACESLRRGECQVAVAGGVNLYLHPAKYHSLCRKRMLALEGKCRSFGAGDDGFVPGEGVGTVVLKPLSKAEADGDHIYGVILASACEHSGRSNGYSAPNPSSQADLIDETLRKADIHPESIGYVEGHGTGTQLGDSLEIVALTQAFRRRTQRTQFCPVGSVKANVGHSESAAGITGVAKILLQFKHGQIPPTIHAREINPNIDFATSPFYLQQEATAWEATNHPRRALINSFGAGGVNACLVLEEYRQPAPARRSATGRPQLIVLSAKNEDRLRHRARQLKDYLVCACDVDMERLAYTLQIGREPMEERLCVMATDAPQLIDQLSLFLAGESSPSIVQGRVEARRKRKPLQGAEKDGVVQAYRGGDLLELAQRWVAGQVFDWDDFHEDSKPVKLSLPTYPFAKQRYWVSDTAVPTASATSEAPATRLHPLVTSNVSTLRETCFLSLLSDQHYYARDHKVNGEMFFPGAGFLEIACVNGTIAGEGTVTSIRDIVWMEPLRFSGGTVSVKTFLKANGHGTEFVIVSFNEENERIVHSEGRLLQGPVKPAPRAVSIADLKQQCGRSLQGAMCYREFEKFGFRYGPAFRTLQELYVGSNFALSKLQLAAELSHDFDQYLLHPCLIDGAMQTVIGVAGEAESDTPYLPFALDEVEILRPVPRVCYAYAELAPSEHGRADIKRFNIQLLNESGEVLVRLNSFYVRALVSAEASRAGHSSGALVSE